MFALCFLVIGAVLTACNAHRSFRYMEDDTVISRRFVDPADFTFTKTEYPAGGIDKVVSMFPMTADVSRRGRFYSTLYFRKGLAHKFKQKNKLLQRNGDGAYLTHAAALRDVINHRMELEGNFEEVSPGRWAEKETPRKRARKGHMNLTFSLL